jgi:hypothetical protein
VLGLIAFVLALLAATLNVTYTSTNVFTDILGVLLEILAFAVLFVVAGLLPARRTGSIWSGLIAGVLVAVGLTTGLLMWAVGANIIVQIFGALALGFAVASTLVFCLPAAVVGRAVYRRSRGALARVSRSAG